MKHATNVVEPTKTEITYQLELNHFILDYKAGISNAIVPVAALVGVQEISAFFSVRPSTVTNWAFRSFDNRFPEPVTRLGATPVYDIRQVVSWYIHWHPRVGKKVGTLPDIVTFFNMTGQMSA